MWSALPVNWWSPASPGATDGAAGAAVDKGMCCTGRRPHGTVAQQHPSTPASLPPGPPESHCHPLNPPHGAAAGCLPCPLAPGTSPVIRDQLQGVLWLRPHSALGAVRGEPFGPHLKGPCSVSLLWRFRDRGGLDRPGPLGLRAHSSVGRPRVPVGPSSPLWEQGAHEAAVRVRGRLRGSECPRRLAASPVSTRQPRREPHPVPGAGAPRTWVGSSGRPGHWASSDSAWCPLRGDAVGLRGSAVGRARGPHRAGQSAVCPELLFQLRTLRSQRKMGQGAGAPPDSPEETQVGVPFAQGPQNPLLDLGTQ